MPDQSFAHLSIDNARFANDILDRDQLFRQRPWELFPHFWRCTVRALIVVDGLDYSLGDFGLNTFVKILLDTPATRVDFDVTLAHVYDVDPSQMMPEEARITNRVTSFKFDEPGHFDPKDFDEVWLFGIASSFFGRDDDADRYPVDRLGDAELAVLAQFMQDGGGLFATGDHAFLGKALSSAVLRARSMRLWDSTNADEDLDEVSMTGPRRNDTNRVGDAGTQFNDQSDDIPQDINPKIYATRYGVWRYKYPHPLLCGPTGVIRVLPDHPHEGECIEAADPDAVYTGGGVNVAEFPDPGGAAPRPLPEIIATSTVLAGNTADFFDKDATVAQSFGAICAYDGHRADVGRVVTDATWHHFVNVNLVGEAGTDGTKGMGFLASAAGQAHFDNIKSYYRNIAVWIARPSLHRCLWRRLLWLLTYNDRVMEAVMTRADLPLAELSDLVLYDIGRHARDVMDRYANQCESWSLMLDLLGREVNLELIPEIDPWWPRPPKPPLPDPAPWLDLSPIFDFVLGSAIAAIREALPEPSNSRGTLVREEPQALDELIAAGARHGLARAQESLAAALENLSTRRSALGRAP